MSYIRSTLLGTSAVCFVPSGKTFSSGKAVDHAQADAAYTFGTPEYNERHAKHVAEIRALVAAGEVDPQVWYDDFAKAQGRDTSLNDDELIEVIADENDNDEDFETAEGRVRLMLEGEARQDQGEDDNGNGTENVETQGPVQGDGTKPKDISISGALVAGTVAPRIIEAKALAVATKLFDDTPMVNEMRANLTRALDAPEITKMAACVLLRHFKAIYGVSAASNYDPILSWPIPYSVEKPDAKNPIRCEVIDGVANPDIYKRFEKNAKGKRVKRSASFYGNMADDMMDGTAEDFAKRRAAIAKAKEKKWDNSQWSQMYVGWKHHELETEDSRIQSRRTRLITLIRQTVQLHRMFLDVASRLPKVVADYTTSPAADDAKNVDIGYGKGRVLRNTMKPIKIYEKADATEFDVYSVSTFLSLNVQKAVDAGGDIGDVYAAFGETTEGDDGEDAKLDLEGFEEMSPDVLYFLEKHKAAIYKRLNSKDPKESDDFLLTLDKMWDELGTIRDKYAKRLDALYSAIEKAAQDANKRGKTGNAAATQQ